MNKWSKVMASALVLIPMSVATVAYADSTTTTGTTTTSTQIPVDSGFNLIYQKNQQREADLLQKAQQVNSPNAAAYSTFVTTVGTQVASLYASEQALTQLGFHWGTAIKNPADGLQNKVKQLQKQAHDLEAKTGRGGKKVSKQDRQAAEKELNQIKKQLQVIGQEIKAVSRIHIETEAKYFAQNVGSLRQSILGLQQDEIRVTQAWVDSGSVTGVVYGSSNTNTNSTVTLNSGSH